MKRNAALLTAGMATVFVTTTAVAATRAVSHSLRDSRPVVSRTATTTSTTATPTTASTPAPVVVTRVENEDVVVVVPAGGSVPTTPVQPLRTDEDAASTIVSAASAHSIVLAPEPASAAARPSDSDDVTEQTAAGAPAPSVQPEPEADDETRTGGGKGGGLNDHRFGTGDD